MKYLPLPFQTSSMSGYIGYTPSSVPWHKSWWEGVGNRRQWWDDGKGILERARAVQDVPQGARLPSPIGE